MGENGSKMGRNGGLRNGEGRRQRRGVVEGEKKSLGEEEEGCGFYYIVSFLAATTKNVAAKRYTSRFH